MQSPRHYSELHNTGGDLIQSKGLSVLVIPAVLPGKIKQGLQVYRVSIVYRTAGGHHKTTVFPHHVNHLFGKGFYIIGRSRLQ